VRLLWDARLPFLAIVSTFVAGAFAITMLQRPLYASRAILGVKPAAIIVSPAAAEAVRTGKIRIGDDGRVLDETDPERQSGPGRYAPRLAAPGLVTLAARDAGVLGADESLDDRQAAAWVQADAIERSDLIALTVWQPAPDAAHALAAAIVERGLEANRREEASRPPELRRELTLVDPPTRPSSPAYPRRDLNLSSGLVLGILAGAVFVIVSEIIRRRP
jgi:uncharacterized protein involved in exopolysaccharide biosynthesis